MRWENKNASRWPIPLVISVPKIFVNGQFYIDHQKRGHMFFLEHSVVAYIGNNADFTLFVLKNHFQYRPVLSLCMNHIPCGHLVASIDW